MVRAASSEDTKKILQNTNKIIEYLQGNETPKVGKWSDLVKKNNKVEPLIIKPKDINQNSSTTKNELFEKINPSDIAVSVSKVKQATQGMVIIHCSDKESIEKLQKTAVNQLGQNYDIKIAQAIKPKIVIVNVKPEDIQDVTEFLAKFKTSNCPQNLAESAPSWNRTSTSSYSSSIKKESGGIPKYDLAFGRSRNDASRKVDDDKPTSRIATRLGTSYNAGYQRDTSVSGYSGRTDTTRMKPILEKKDSSHPPVTYRPIGRTEARSREPSPVEKSEKSSSSSSSFSYNRLYPRPYQGSIGREKTDSISPSRSIPKYSGRTSTSRDEIPRYGDRSSISKEDSLSSKYSRNSAREDLSSGSQKYINSRFLPKNTVEKSYTAHTRPSNIRTNETSRKNRELLNVLHAQQEQDRLSRSSSRCSSVTTEDSFTKERNNEVKAELPAANAEQIEFETVTVITRSTSPTPVTTQNTSYLRSRRIEIAKYVEKQITRPKIRRHRLVDKEMQSDRLDDTTKTSRFAGASRISTAPWSSVLDMKFSTPNAKQKTLGKSEGSSQDDEKLKEVGGSPKSISRNNSSKSINSSQSKSEKPKEIKKSPSPSKSKIVPPKQVASDKKQLPPQIPKGENMSKSNSLHSIQNANKDFRKSVLNMNPDGKSKQKFGRRSNSVSSAESDAADPDATDISENLASCKSYHTSASKLPQKIFSDKSMQRNSRSPSFDASTSCHTSSSDDDHKTKQEKMKRKSTNSSRTSIAVSSADELSLDKSLKPPQSPRNKVDGVKSESEAKSFLMRALAPVTNLFKVKNHGSEERINWMDPSSEGNNEISQNSVAGDNQNSNNQNSNSVGLKNSSSGLRPAKIIIHRVESGEKPWWLEEKSESLGQEHTNSSNLAPQQEKIVQQPVIRHVESGEIPWWLDENAQVPEGVETYPNWVREDGTTENGRVIYKMRKNDSGNTSWWLSSSEKTDSNKNAANIMDSEYLEKHKIRHIDSGERSWWLNSSEDISEMVQATEGTSQKETKYAIRHQDSGETAWWLQQNTTEVKKEADYDFDQEQIPLGDRASPEGLEMPKEDEGRQSPYDNVPTTQFRAKRPLQLKYFISKHTNIDDILGGSTQIWSPLIDRLYEYENDANEKCTEIDATQVIIHEGIPQRTTTQATRINRTGISRTSASAKYLNDIDPFSYSTNFPDPARPPLHTFSVTLPLINQLAAIHRLLKSPHRLDDAALQLYKDGDYGSYLDLEASISEQQEEFEGFQSNKKNSIVLRTQLSVRVHTIIEKLLTSEGRELRRALFSLKQIFQEDKDLVHEFVQNDGLSCLIKVGSEADQNYQNYILRALGQVMLYVDGMNGVMEHNLTIQWLYSLISSKFRLVVKTALKLLLVFVEYTDSNCMLLIKAIHTVDYSQGVLPYHNIMKLLKDFDSADTELLIYATTLINKILNGIPDQDTYYDQIDVLEEQGFEAIIQRYMSKPGTDLDLLQQFQIYEAVLQYEDGEEINVTPIRHLDESVRKTIRNRKSVVDSSERRKSRRHSTGNTPLYTGLNRNNNNNILQTNKEDEDDESSSSQSSGLNNSQLNGSYKDKAIDAGVTPALKRRRERAERQRSFMKEQETAAFFKGSLHITENNENENGNYTNAFQQRMANGNGLNRNSSRKDLTPLLNAVNKLDSEDSLNKQPWIYSMIQNQENLEDSENTNEIDRNVLLQLKRENTVKDITQKLANQNILHSPSDENKVNRIGDMSGLISKAKEGLAKSKSKVDLLRSPSGDGGHKIEVKKSENELRWEELIANLNRSLNLCDMDFTDLGSEDEVDILAPAVVTNGVPPPPPPLRDMGGCAPPPPPLSNRMAPPAPCPPLFGVNSQRYSRSPDTKIPLKKNKKTVKLFWKEVRDDPISQVKLKTGLIWDELASVNVDTQKLEHLFESRAKDLITKKQQEMNKNKEIIVLDPKRSNAINIGMTKLPPPRSIKTAILKMDATIMNREGIEKLLTMLPTEEERTKIQEAQAANPDLPLGSAEQFLLTLASISELTARLKLWAFKLDFENSEKEIAEPLMDLKQGFEVLRVNKTFRGILSTLLSIGNFLNGNEVKGFQIEYLAKVPEVKDTVHKHSLLHHLCHIVMEKFPDATDLYSEIGAITRASKIDFDELALNIQRLESDCKASWDHLKLIAKHDGSTMMKVKMSDFLSDCAERIILLEIIHRRIINRFHKFLLWLGIPLHQISDTKPNEFCRIVSEFALEYRTTRERVIQQLEKKANHRERNKTRGKMITDIGKFRSKEDRADAELRQLLGSDISDVESMQGTLPWRRTRRDGHRSFLNPANGNLTDGDDEIIESLVKTATKGPSTRTAPRERKRTRHADRKSLKRSRTRENNPFGSRDSP